MDLEGPGCRPFQFRGAVEFRVELSRPIVIVLALALASRVGDDRYPGENSLFAQRLREGGYVVTTDVVQGAHSWRA